MLSTSVSASSLLARGSADVSCRCLTPLIWVMSQQYLWKSPCKHLCRRKTNAHLHYVCFTGCKRAAQRWWCTSKILCGHRKDMMVQQMPNLLLIWQPWACCRCSSSCLWFASGDVSGFCCGRLSKSNLSTWMAILRHNREDCNQRLACGTLKMTPLRFNRFRIIFRWQPDNLIPAPQYEKKGGTDLKSAWYSV